MAIVVEHEKRRFEILEINSIGNGNDRFCNLLLQQQTMEFGRRHNNLIAKIRGRGAKPARRVADHTSTANDFDIMGVI